METIEFITEKRGLHDLKPCAWNPRTLTKKQAKDLTKSLDKFSLAEIPVVNLDGTIIAGHQRIEILKKKHSEQYEIPVRVPTRLMTDEEVQEYNIRSNKNTGDFDFDALGNHFDAKDLVEWGFDADELGIDLFDDDLSDEKPEPEPKEIECPNCQATFTI